jgi:hypothetical protein
MTAVRVEVETETERLSVVVELDAATSQEAASWSTLGGGAVAKLQAAAMAAVDEVRRQGQDL